MRKHFAFYVKGLINAKQMRNKLVRVESPKEVIEIMKMAEY
jgi:tRNA-dihydrouridine synthase